MLQRFPLMPPGDARRKRQTQQERVAESSRRLLAAAIEVVAEKGYGPATAAEISERAGYSAPMVRTRYGSKQALLESRCTTPGCSQPTTAASTACSG